ncbi:MAG: hypothetical protein ABJL54_08030 [Halioglobus sp.]
MRHDEPDNKGNEVEYPWYDSNWLNAFVKAKKIIEEECPADLPFFLEAMEQLNAPLDFRTQKITQVLDQKDFRQIKDIIANLQQDEMDKGDLLRLGRLVAHDLPEISKIHEKLTGMVSDRVNEELIPSYNFVSLYNNLGVCEVHMDAPTSKWTLDLCIECSDPWPIYLSQCVSWPESFVQEQENWADQIILDPAIRMEKFILIDNQAALFSGSNQWHYRERMPRIRRENFCHLVFFQYVPIGCKDIINPNQWWEVFNIPQLKKIDYAMPLPALTSSRAMS